MIHNKTVPAAVNGSIFPPFEFGEIKASKTTGEVGRVIGSLTPHIKGTVTPCGFPTEQKLKLIDGQEKSFAFGDLVAATDGQKASFLAR